MPPSGQPASLPDDLQQLQAEILEGLESSDEEHDEVGLAFAAGATKLATDVGESSGDLTEAAVLAAAEEKRLEDVSQLIFRERQLKSLATVRTVDFDYLINLEVLSLSNNLLEDIEPLAVLSSLVELNVNFNRIVDLSPLYECEQLEKLFAAHNRVDTIDGLEACGRLRELSLFANCLEDAQELSNTLQALPELRALDVGQNQACASSAQRFRLLQALPGLDSLDGQPLTSADRQLAADFLSRLSSRESGTGSEGDFLEELGEQGPDLDRGQSHIRPTTAPAPGSRPPLMPLQGAAIAANPLAPLPGQKLRSARANRIDDVLTKTSREGSPEIADTGMPVLDSQALDLSDPERALGILTNHADALRQWFDTLRAERENLRFQVRLLQQDEKASEPDEVLQEVKRLETENRNIAAVESENTQLKARLQQLEREQHALPARKISDNGEDSDALAELKWENRLLEKRLERLTRYADQLRHGTMRNQGDGKPVGLWSPATSAVAESILEDVSSPVSQAARGPKVDAGDGQDVELTAMLADNESLLDKVRGELRVQTANIDRPTLRSDECEIAGANNSAAQGHTVDVLTLDAQVGGEDVEWHGAVTAEHASRKHR